MHSKFTGRSRRPPPRAVYPVDRDVDSDVVNADIRRRAIVVRVDRKIEVNVRPDGEELQEELVIVWTAALAAGTIDYPGDMPVNDVGRCRCRGDANEGCRQHGDPNPTHGEVPHAAPQVSNPDISD